MSNDIIRQVTVDGELKNVPSSLLTLKSDGSGLYEKFYNLIDGVYTVDAQAISELEAQTNRANAKVLLAEYTEADIEYDGVMFQYDSAAKVNMTDLITESELLKEAGLLPDGDETSTQWILSDNTTRETSITDIKAIVKLGALRRLAVQNAYTAYTQTDMSVPFEYSPDE